MAGLSRRKNYEGSRSGLIYTCLLSVLSLTALLPTPASAGDSGFYAGIKGGAFGIDTSEDDDGFDTAWGPIVGFRFNEYIAAEVEYLTLDSDNDDGETFDASLWIVSVRPTLPLTERWALYAKLGWAWPDGEYKNSASRGEFIEGDDDFFGGLGVAWQLDHFHLRGEYQSNFEITDRNDGRLDIITLSLGFSF